MAGDPRGRPRWLARPFILGLVCGVSLAVSGRLAVNRTPIADWLVSPLLRADTPGQADAIVVLGAGVLGNCVPNINAVRRVILAARLWKEGRAPLVLFTGGPPKGLPCAVAAVMADLAKEMGIPPDRVRIEADSHSTHENGARSAPLLHTLGATRVLLVTDRLHVTRAAGTFTHFGFATLHASVPVSQGHPDNMSMLYGGLREYLALAYYAARGWLGSPPAT